MHTTQVVRLPEALLPLLLPLAAVSTDLDRGPVLLVFAWLLLALSLKRSLQLGVALRLLRLSSRALARGMRPALGASVLLARPKVGAAALDAVSSAGGDSDPEPGAVGRGWCISSMLSIRVSMSLMSCRLWVSS